MSGQQEIYLDEDNRIYVKGEYLGGGRQGEVFRSKDNPDIAIKVIKKDGLLIKDSRKIEQYCKELEHIRQLPLPEGSKVSVPIVVLKNTAGYVMQLLNEMESITKSFYCPKQSEGSVIPKWLAGLSPQIVHYYQTGGLRRRLETLYKCSSILARFHAAGFVYGDISPNNVFVSKDVAFSEVWLIDSDNVDFETKRGSYALRTPEYGAPEIVQGVCGNRPASDCYSFAIMAFKMLSLIHPFNGKMLDGPGRTSKDNGNPDKELYDGTFPWIDDCNDRSNATEGGLPRSFVLTRKLSRLFQRTFGEGRTSLRERPVIYHWPVALAQAADATIKCSYCQMSWYCNYEGDICPFCHNQKPEMLILEAYKWNGRRRDLSKPCWTFVRENVYHQNISKISIPQRVIDEFSMTDNDISMLEFVFSDQHMVLKKTEACSYRIMFAAPEINNGEFIKVNSQTRIPWDSRDTFLWIYVDSTEPRIIRCSRGKSDK